ncbi:MAG: hypothetical protein AMXMBFR56_73290 [Polyangiaceae bacterium]
MRVARLPPERSTRLAVVGSVCCSSCCCCCCCLHALGGLVGAAMGSAWAVVPSATEANASTPSGARDGAALTVAVHWTVVFALSVAAFVIGSLVDVHDGIWIGLASVVLGLPAFQLAAFVLGLVLAPLFPVPNKGSALKALGKIALVSFLGSLLGAGLLAVGLVLYLGAK